MVPNNGGELRGHGSMTGVANAECAPQPVVVPRPLARQPVHPVRSTRLGVTASTRHRRRTAYVAFST